MSRCQGHHAVVDGFFLVFTRRSLRFTPGYSQWTALRSGRLEPGFSFTSVFK
jgi:hypothetical protein